MYFQTDIYLANHSVKMKQCNVMQYVSNLSSECLKAKSFRHIKSIKMVASNLTQEKKRHIKFVALAANNSYRDGQLL